MKKREWSEALNHIDNDIVINFIKQRDVLQKKNKTKKFLHENTPFIGYLPRLYDETE